LSKMRRRSKQDDSGDDGTDEGTQPSILDPVDQPTRYDDAGNVIQ